MNQNTISEFIKGSERAFFEIFKLYAPKALRVGRQVFRNEELAKDFVQDLMIRVWIRRENFYGVENFERYLLKMAWNLSRDLQKSSIYRHQTSQRFITVHEGLVVHNDLEHLFTDSDYRQLIEQALAHAPERLHLIYKLSREEGLSPKEIAKRLNLAKQTVDNEMSKALKVIRGYLKTHAISMLFLLSYGYWLA